MHVLEMFKLDGRIALVTGGAGILGTSIVRGLAEAGATVIMASRNKTSLLEVQDQFSAEGLEVAVLQFDQGDHDSIVALREEIRSQYGRLDIFVNNAVARPMKSPDAAVEDIALSMKINAVGVIDVIRELVPLLEQSDSGSIINISSMMGMFGPDLSNYEGTDMGTPPPDYFFHKGGMINLTKYYAKVLAGKNIRVNTVSPGGIFNNQPQRFIENYIKKVPLRRFGTGQDFKGIMVLLASEAGSYINGENILIDGGLWA